MNAQHKSLSREQPETSGDAEVFHVIGTRPIRPDGEDKVTGRALFGNDIKLTGMLYGAVLRSPHAHAKILDIDIKEAVELPGVFAVITSDDLPDLEDKLTSLGEGSINLRYQSWNVLACGKVLYFGHPIAAVAATNQQIARQALSLIHVKFEVLPPVLEVRQAMKDDAPVLLINLRTDELGLKADQPTNIAWHGQVIMGDPEEGFKKAETVVEREFTTSTVHQGYIEPHAATALWNRDGNLTVWCSTQGAFGVRDQLIEILGISFSKVRVIPTEIGGGFGGKIGVYLEPLAALLSKKSGNKPVKMNMDYSEVLSSTGPTSASWIKVKMGATLDGKLVAAQAVLAYEAGAFPGSNVGSGMDVIFAPYAIPNVQIDGYDVLVNKPRSAAYRAPGGTNANFACETVIDELSVSLGMDPLEFRILNGVRSGERRVDGPIYPEIGYVQTVQAALNHPHYKAPIGGTYRGRGVASGYWGNYGGKSSASASINPDGSISLLEGSVDIGGSRASIAMQLAETLHLPFDAIRPMVADTDMVGYTEGTYGSRTTFATGIAVIELGKKLIHQMKERVSCLWGVEHEKIIYSKGIFQYKENQISFEEIAARLDETGGPVVASSAVNAEKWGPAFATHIVDVEVDPETGKVNILRYTAVQDVGKAIHPSYVEGQIQGGVSQGIGWGLNEEYFYDDEGKLLNASLLDYRLPTCLDLPMIDTVLVEVANPEHPFGVRGVGEVPIVPPPAALANAIFRAIGVRMKSLPMSPGRILEEYWKKGEISEES